MTALRCRRRPSWICWDATSATWRHELQLDFAAITDFTSVASGYRSVARAYYRSSAGFGAVQDRILAMAEGIGSLSSDTLTNSSMDSIMRNGADDLAARLEAKLDEWQAKNQLLRLELRGMAPARQSASIQDIALPSWEFVLIDKSHS
jgi:hypothetical protein